MIEQVKQNLNLRNSIFTLNLFARLNINIVVAIQKMLKQEKSVAEKLEVNCLNVVESKWDYKEIIPQYEEAKHPILYRFISMKAKF